MKRSTSRRVHAGVRNGEQSTADIIASATATEDGTSEEIGARVTGMTVCPCSQGMSASRARRRSQ